MTRLISLLGSFFMLLGLAPSIYAQKSSIVQRNEQVLFKSGEGGYACYRIPALIALSDREIVAFAEGRKQNCADFGDVDILMRRSNDGGQSWSQAKVVVDNGSLQAGNPTPVLDRLDPAHPRGRLFLFYNTGTASEHETRQGLGRRRGFFISSTDGGLSWSKPTDISSSVHWDRHSPFPEKDARTFAFAPGHAVQFDSGPFVGRIYVPSNHSLGPPQEGFKDYRSYGVYSDDHGNSWSVAEDLGLPSSNEVMAVALEQELILLVRVQNEQYKRKAIARSIDGGVSWYDFKFPNALTTPMCQSSIIKTLWCSPRHKSSDKDITLWHLGPRDTLARKNLSLWFSTNKGHDWGLVGGVYSGSSAYSDMVSIAKGRLGVLYERNQYGEIAFSVLVL